MAAGPENLRFLLWKAGVERAHWADQLASWVRCDSSRARHLLTNATPTPSELQNVAHVTETTEEQLLFASLLEDAHVDILHANVSHLVGGLDFGGKKQLAAALGANPTTVSRWLAGSHRPHRSALIALVRFFGLPVGTDLERDPVFLSPSPVTASERRRWLRERVDKLDATALDKLFPAFERLLGDA